MNNNKLIDCITFFDNKLMFDLRFNILKDHVDFFVVCESKYDHRNNPKKLNFDLKFLKNNKVKYVVLDKPFPNESDIWKNQAIQREFLLNSLDSFVRENDFVFFSDPDEIPNPSLLINFNLKKNMVFFFKIVLILSLIYTIPTKPLGKEQELVRKKTLSPLIS